MNNTTLKTFLALLIFLTFNFANGQDKIPNLGIGDTAPELNVTWLKGGPISSFEEDKLYVVEFWATWCTPCVGAMPHLSELAKKYEDRVTFIGVNIWEKVAKDQSYESLKPMLLKFVEGMGDKMAYIVAMDNNNLYMTKYWMRAANQNGIPASFLVKGGKVIWIGHPHVIENIIKEVLAGTYNMQVAINKGK